MGVTSHSDGANVCHVRRALASRLAVQTGYLNLVVDGCEHAAQDVPYETLRGFLE